MDKNRYRTYGFIVAIIVCVFVFYHHIVSPVIHDKRIKASNNYSLEHAKVTSELQSAFPDCCFKTPHFLSLVF